MIINKKTEGTDLYEIEITLKGSKEKTTIYAYAKNRMDASNALILRKIYGKQHSIRFHTSNHLK